MIALDVRELIRRHVFDQPAGSAFRLNLAYPWLRVMRLNSSSLDLQLVTGRSVIVPLVWASCGVMGERMRLECPLCGQRVCALLRAWPGQSYGRGRPSISLARRWRNSNWSAAHPYALIGL
jgi:hypothetical protein